MFFAKKVARCPASCPSAKDSPAWPTTVSAVSRNDELERYRAAVRRQLIREFVERWGVCERGHVLTDLNRDKLGRCWCCTRAHERAFDSSRQAYHGRDHLIGTPRLGSAGPSP